MERQTPHLDPPVVVLSCCGGYPFARDEHAPLVSALGDATHLQLTLVGS